MSIISICIPTYKRPTILAATLSHLASITEMDLEVIVSDNCSQDETPDVVAQFTGKFASLRYHCQNANRGGVINSQTALSMASGKYAYLLSDDDHLVPAGIHAAINMLDKHPHIVAIYGGYQEWDPCADRILQTISFVNEPQIYHPSDKLKLFNHFNLLWLPIVRTDVYQRFSLYDVDNNGIWTLINMLMTFGTIAVIPDVLYLHAHTEPRMEYDLTESWYHDKYRADYELFYASMELDMTDPNKAMELMHFIGSRTIHAYLQGYRFACMKNDYLKQRHFLLRSRAYGLVTSEQLIDWERRCLVYASSERLRKALSALPDVRVIVIEKTDVLRRFMSVMAEMFPDLPSTIEVSRDEFIHRRSAADEFLLAEQFSTLASRNTDNPHTNRGTQYALYDLFANLRITTAPLNISI